MSFMERVCQALMVVNLFGTAPWNNNNKNHKVITSFFYVFSYIAIISGIGLMSHILVL